MSNARRLGLLRTAAQSCSGPSERGSDRLQGTVYQPPRGQSTKKRACEARYRRRCWPGWRGPRARQAAAEAEPAGRAHSLRGTGFAGMVAGSRMAQQLRGGLGSAVPARPAGRAAAAASLGSSASRRHSAQHYYSRSRAVERADRCARLSSSSPPPSAVGTRAVEARSEARLCRRPPPSSTRAAAAEPRRCNRAAGPAAERAGHTGVERSLAAAVGLDSRREQEEGAAVAKCRKAQLRPRGQSKAWCGAGAAVADVKACGPVSESGRNCARFSCEFSQKSVSRGKDETHALSLLASLLQPLGLPVPLLAIAAVAVAITIAPLPDRRRGRPGRAQRITHHA